MSADGDIVRENVGHIARGCRSGSSHNPAVYEQAIAAALARLEADVEKYKRAHKVAADFANEKLIPRAVAAEAQRDALAKALREATTALSDTSVMVESENDGWEELVYDRLCAEWDRARAALAEAGIGES